MLSGKKTVEALNRMAILYPDAKGELNYASDFQCLIAVMLSAQTTDAAVNKATPNLFKTYPNPEKMAKASPETVMTKIKTIGLYKNKAKNVVRTAQIIMEEYKGLIPKTVPELMKLPGVGKKTANVVVGDLYSIPAIAVDTHVERIAKRLRICKQSANVLEVEETLMKKIPKDRWIEAHHTMILFGRYHCTARSPKCEGCLLFDLCAAGQKIVSKKENVNNG